MTSPPASNLDSPEIWQARVDLAACFRAALHTHMPNATALTMVEGEPLAFAGQTALKFHGRTAVDDAYNGLAMDESEGDRIAEAASGADIVFMRRHGILVLAPTIAKARDDLYYLERACEVQRLAQSTGRRLIPVPTHTAEATAQQMRHEGGRDSPKLHLDSIKRQLDRDAPEYRQ